MKDPIASDSDSFWNKLETLLKSREVMLAWLLAVICLLYIPFKITSYGWMPQDDALRHAAHGVNEKSWGEVVVIRPEFDVDHNPGWHSILRFMHRNFAMDQDDLLLFSVIGLYLLFNMTGALLSPRPLAWITALGILALTDLAATFRVIIGRPYLVSCSVALLLLSLWTKKELNLRSWRPWVVSIIALALAVWIHGSWYLFLLMPFAFFLAGQSRRAGAILLCLLIATVLGALMSGHPVEFLRFHFQAPLQIFSEMRVNRQLVSEFQSGNTAIVLVVFCAILALHLQRKNCLRLADLATDPIFMLAVTGWLLGIMVNRFWGEWGRVAITLWLSLRISDLIDVSAAMRSPRVRYCLAVFACVMLVFLSTHDERGRYSEQVMDEAIHFSDPRFASWVPQPDSLIYSNTMLIFYKHYFAYPTATWKYVVGFESSLMPEDDLKVLRSIHFNYNHGKEFAPWVKKMRPQDLLITRSKISGIDGIEWIQASRNFFIGRRKFKAADSANDANAANASESTAIIVPSDPPASD